MNTKKNRFSAAYDQYYDQGTKPQNAKPKEQKAEQKSEMKPAKNRFAAAYGQYFNSSEGEIKKKATKPLISYSDEFNRIAKEHNIDTSLIGNGPAIIMAMSKSFEAAKNKKKNQPYD